MKNWLLLIAILALSPLAQATMNTYTLDTQHQLASDLVPTLQELVAPGGMVTSFNNVLIIKTTETNYQQLLPLIQQLDTPIKQLLISVTSDERTARNNQRIRLDGEIKAGDTKISVGQRDEDKITIDYGTGSRDGKGTQTVRAMEGQPAFVQIGEQIPVRSSNGWSTSTDYKNVVRGFYVTARVSGNSVDVSINTQNDRVKIDNQRRIKTQSASTRVRVKLGEWVQIGGLNETQQTQNSQINSRQSGTLNRSGGFYLKVDSL